MTKVSVISTVYNGEEFIRQAADSILTQDYDDYEWIILDDQSTDSTPEKLSDLEKRDDRVQIITPSKHLGRATSLNRVVEAANGGYIAQQDIDDISFSQRLSQQAEYLDKNTNVGVVGSYYEKVDKLRDEHYVRELPTNHEELVQALASYIPFAHTLVMFRKEAWYDAGKYPKKQDLEDLSLWINMVSAGWELGNIPENLGKHFIYEESSWNQRFEHTQRQRHLAKVQARAVAELDMPVWMYIYPLGRLLYPYLPTPVKRSVRRIVGGIQEREL